MVTFDAQYPAVVLPGSEEYWNTYDWADTIEVRFPLQGAYDLGSACQRNEWGPLAKSDIRSLVMLVEGENEELSWEWEIELWNGTKWRVVAGCDYTGWDCQSSIEFEQIACL